MVTKIGTWRDTDKNRRQTTWSCTSYCKSEDEWWFLGFDEKGSDVFLKDVGVVVEDNVNQQGNAEFGFRIKDELVEDEEKIVKIMPEIQKLDRTRLPCLRKIEKAKLFPEVRKVN